MAIYSTCEYTCTVFTHMLMHFLLSCVRRQIKDDLLFCCYYYEYYNRTLSFEDGQSLREEEKEFPATMNDITTWHLYGISGFGPREDALLCKQIYSCNMSNLTVKNSVTKHILHKWLDQ